MAEPIEAFDSPEACVDARCAGGADRIKLIATGIINFKKAAVTAKPQMSAAEVCALTAAARRHGRQCFAHASGADGVGNVIEGGVTSVEHGFFITRDQLARMRDRRIAWVPTFIPVQVQVDRAAELGWSEKIAAGLKGILDGHAESLRLAHEMGVSVLAGSDAGSCGVPHGLGLLAELELLERAGMPAPAVLNAATGKSAALLELQEPVGRLAAGYRPRMIFTRHSPLEALSNLRRPKTVVFDGRVLACDGEVDESVL
jgi:imidazolonepropionase-like amidohydrolase